MEDDRKGIYQCNLCDKSYSYPGTLKTHMIMSHSEEDSYKCNQCDFLWISIQDLKTHTQVHHRRDPPKSCNACKLRTVGDVAEHNTLFHKQKDATMATMTMHVSCEQCENTFKTSNGLKIHLLVHHIVALTLIVAILPSN